MEFRSDFGDLKTFSFAFVETERPFEQTKVGQLASGIISASSSLRTTTDSESSLLDRASIEEPLSEREASISSTTSRSSISDRMNSSIKSFFSFSRFVSRKRSEELSKILGVSNKTILEGRHIAQGKAKHVWKIAGEESFVYYTAVKAAFHRGMNPKEREIREEVETAKDIQANLVHEIFPEITKEEAKQIINAYGTIENWLNQIEQGETHDVRIEDSINGVKLGELKMALLNLAVNLEEVDVHFSVKGEGQQTTVVKEYAVKAEAARGDLDEEFKKSYTLEKAKVFGKGILNALSALHKAGFLHRDIKPANFLCVQDADGNLSLKLSDFGKTRQLREGKESMHMGNQVYAAPEGKDTPKSEVYSAGLILIRIFEETLLQGKDAMLETGSSYLDTGIASEGKKGIEKFLIQNTQAFQKQLSKIGRVITGVKEYVNPYARTAQDLNNAELETHRYIDALALGLRGKMGDGKINQLAVLLKDMTRSIPDQRISMETALSRYQEIFS